MTSIKRRVPVLNVFYLQMLARMSAVRVARLQDFAPRRALSVKFYAMPVGESMRAELWLQVMAGSSRLGFASSAKVGKPPNAKDPRMAAHGYKRSAGASRTPSAEPPAPDIRTLNFRP